MQWLNHSDLLLQVSVSTQRVLTTLEAESEEHTTENRERVKYKMRNKVDKNELKW